MSEAKRKPAAFLSYSHADTNVERLTEFRKRLSQEVSKQIGEEFPIFQDEDSVQWGNNWQERIEESLDEVTFFIPIVTPGFFKSPNCRDELEQFLDRERELGRRDLILPVYYVDYPLMNDKSRRSNDVQVYVIATRQYADWRHLRNEPFTSPPVEEAIVRLAAGIREALEQVQDRETAPPQPAAKPEPPTRVVDPYGSEGTFNTVGEAIEAADPRDRILVRPGLYQEGLVVDKPLEIIGDGDVTEIEVQATGKSTLVFDAAFGRVANLTLTALPKAGAKKKVFGVEIVQGRLELEGCDISSRDADCVRIHDGNPRLRRNRIHDGVGSGKHWMVTEDVLINLGCGVQSHQNAHGTLEDNDIFDNDSDGVFIYGGSNLTMRRNTIHDNRESGVYVVRNSHLTLEDNVIVGNGRGGVEIAEQSTATLRRNRINRNSAFGVWVGNPDTVRITIQDNDLRNNASGPVGKHGFFHFHKLKANFSLGGVRSEGNKE